MESKVTGHHVLEQAGFHSQEYSKQWKESDRILVFVLAFKLACKDCKDLYRVNMIS